MLDISTGSKEIQHKDLNFSTAYQKIKVYSNSNYRIVKHLYKIVIIK